MKGTARSTAPGTRVATVTGIQTCWARRSICSISSRCTSRRIDARLVGDQPAEVAGLAVEREHADEAVERVDVGDGAPTPAARRPRSGPGGCGRTRRRGPGAQAPEPRAASRLRRRRASSRRRGACRAARSATGSSRKMRRFQPLGLRGELLLDDEEGRAPGRRARQQERWPSGGRVAAATSAPTPKPARAPPSWRTRNAVASTAEWMRASRTARSSLTPSSAASRSPTWRASGPTTSRNDVTERTPPAERRPRDRRARTDAADRRAAAG